MKHIRVLGVLAIALTLGLAACGGKGGNQSGGEESQAESQSQHKHYAADDAPWQMDDSRHWKDCADGDGGKVDAASHKWVKDESKTDVAATCQAEGKAYEKCSVCGKTRERTVAKAAHTYEQVDGADKVVWSKEPTCTEGGEGEKECTVCHEKEAVTADPLGHVYEQVDGADKVVWSKEATCTEAGVGEKECTRCHEKATVTQDALGHKFELVGDDTEPEAGKAKVRVYTCANGCGATNLGFKASEVTDASKAHLVIGDDGGARFWGRPIGNAIALTADGTSVNQTNYECVYCKSETGDFFEYVFDLTAAQAKTLENCYCYVDAKPAAYLGGQDFWACDESADEWTPGYYIDDDPSHLEVDADGKPVMVADHALPVRADDGSEAEGVATETQVQQGKRISNYRYILYVDDKVQAFDPEIKAPVSGRGGSEPRAEYQMPYLFHLHEGENKISLRMAGGYRSQIYNFIFRAVEEEEPSEEHTHKYLAEKAGALDAIVDVYNCEAGDASALRWDAKSYDASSTEIEAAAADGSIRFNRAQGKNGETDVGGHLVYKINSPVAAKDVELSFYIQAHNQNVAIFDAVANDSGMGKDVDADGKFTVTPTKRYALYVNDVRVELGEDPGKSTAKDWFTFPAKFDLKAGENKIEVVSLGGYRAKMYNFQLNGLPKILVPVYTWESAAVKAGLSNGGATEATGHYVEGGEETFTTWKMGTAGDKLTLTYTAAAAGKVTLRLAMTTKNSNVASAGVWYQGSSQKTKVTLNGTELPAPAKEDDKNLQQWGCTVRSPDAKDGSSALACPIWVDLIELDLVAGENTIVIDYLGGGYSYWFSGAQLAK